MSAAKVKTRKSKTKAAAPAPAKTEASKTPAPAAKTKPKVETPVMGRAVALKEAGDLAGPFQVTPAAREAGTPAALKLRKDSARWAVMAYAFKHPKEKIERADLERIAGTQLGQALSGLTRYRYLAAVPVKQAKAT